MSFEETLKEVVREVVREEIQALSCNDQQLLTAESVAALLAYSEHEVRRLRREGHLHGFMLGKNSLRFRRSEVERFIQTKERVA